MSGSTLLVVQSWILDRLAQDARCATVQMELSYPGQRLQPEALYFSSARTSSRQAAIKAGIKRADEQLEITGHIWCSLDGTDPATVSARSLEVLAALDELIRLDPQLPGADLTDDQQIVDTWVTSWAQEIGPTERGNGAKIDFTITVNSRVT